MRPGTMLRAMIYACFAWNLRLTRESDIVNWLARRLHAMLDLHFDGGPARRLSFGSHYPSSLGIAFLARASNPIDESS
jgi:hypothetical protein